MWPTSAALYLLVLTAGYFKSVEAQPAPVDAISIFVVLKCLPASFLSYGLNGVPLDAGSAGTDNLGPADGAGLAVLSPPVKQALTTIFADDLAQLKQLRALPGSRPECPAVNVGPQVWETLFSLSFNKTDFDPYTDENKFLLALYFVKITDQAVLQVNLPSIKDLAVLPTATSITNSVVAQAIEISGLVRANANDATLGPLVLGQATDIFTRYLQATGGFEVAPGLLSSAPFTPDGELPRFATVDDYLRLLNIPGSRKGGQFYPDGIILEPSQTATIPTTNNGRRLLGSTLY